MKLFLVSVSDNDHQRVKELLENTKELKEWYLPLTEQGHPVWFVALQKNRTAGWLAGKLEIKASDNPTITPNTGVIVEVSDYHGYHHLDVWQQLDTWWDL